MKLCVLIMSCAKHRYTHQAVRETWLRRNPGIDYKFLVGDYQQEEDELFCEGGDSYEEVTHKSRSAFRWALNEKYTHVLHCGRDTYVNLDRLLTCGFERRDYAGARTAGGVSAGFVPLHPDNHGWFEYGSGGAGTWLSEHAMRLIVESPLFHAADDLLYGWILGTHGIPLFHTTRFQKNGELLYSRNAITTHLSKGTGVYDPAWMYYCHARSL